ncbi:addiction module antidote protein, HigA family [Alcaligenes faecalis]|uniref:HigA family addiction module antitoxin n=1 Tax=Alcaligenes faecalis TaxID=511 RepID=UPI000A2EA01B|nr:HigA family addiction module antitoxin [Alcaligenes faecalis]OSZ33566.1 addiction module antidote protein, HigA family [Alcaligenes faecalis]OSZ47539.1 addiction module antidote protein, HigA family [Alcaligenes faecalis]
MAMKNPPYPGQLIKEDVMAPLGLSLRDAAIKFDVETEYLAAVLTGHAPLNITLAENLEKAGISTARTWIALQEAYDREKQQ